MTQISHRMWGLWIKIIGYRKLCSMVCFFVSVCVPKAKYGNIVLGHGLIEILGLKSEGVARGWRKLHSEELHDWYWWVNVGGRWTERLWEGWDKRKETREIKNKQKISLGNPERKRHFGRPTTRWDTKDNVMKRTWRIAIPVCFPLSTIQILPSE